MTLPRLSPGELVTDRVFDAIHRAIVTGDLEPGRRLLIRDVADELGTSVMPVREAFRRLESTGLLDSTPYKGAVVKPLTTHELLHVYDVRRLLEAEASRLGAAAVTPEDLAAMRQEFTALQETLAEGRAGDYLDHDEALLSILYAASGNPVLLDTIRILWNRCRSYKLIGVEQAMRTADTSVLLLFQEQLIAAAAEHSGDAARDAADASLRRATERIRAGLPAPPEGGRR